MIDVILIAAIIIGGGFTFVALLLALDPLYGSGAIERRVACIAAFVMLFCAGWLTSACQQEWRITKKLTSSSVTVNNVNQVTFCDDEETYMFNINDRFGRTFEDGTKFTLKFRDLGPYFGVWFSSNRTVLEIGEPDPC